jgi:hypothetical protein
LAGVGLATVVVACGAVKDRGELIVAMQTDLSLPKDIDHIEISVTSYGKTLWDQDYAAGPNGVRIPGTLGVVGDPNNPSAPVEIQIIARQAGSGSSPAGAHVLRDVTTTVPSGTTSLLRMPIEWLCWNQVTGTSSSPSSTCPVGQTCIAGSCSSNSVDSAYLKPYSPSSVFGGSNNAASGECLNAISCFASAVLETPDPSDCSIAAPAGASAGLNVALLRNNLSDATDEVNGSGVGLCPPPSGNTPICYVPLDQDPTEGWSLSGGKVMLPPAVCRLLTTASPAPAANVAVVGVVVASATAACPAKTPEIPTCGAWDSVGSPSENGLPEGGSGSSTGCTGTWTSPSSPGNCGNQTATSAVSVQPGSNGNYVVSVTAGPFDNGSGGCETLDDSKIEVTPGPDGTLTFSPSLSQICSCTTAGLSITLSFAPGCQTVTAQETFTGTSQCPTNGGTPEGEDAGAAPMDAATVQQCEPGPTSYTTVGPDGGEETGSCTMPSEALLCPQGVTPTASNPDLDCEAGIPYGEGQTYFCCTGSGASSSSSGSSSGGSGSNWCATCGSATCAPLTVTFTSSGTGTSSGGSGPDGAIAFCQTCSTLGATCGNPGDDCGNVLSCGTCTGSQVCQSNYQCGGGAADAAEATCLPGACGGNGCCLNGECYPGTNTLQCGTGGNICASCGATGTCSAGVCAGGAPEDGGP